MFNWVHRSSDGGDYTAMFNMINNYYKPGPATPKDTPVGHRILKPEAGRSKLDHKVYGRVYADGNIMEGYPPLQRITGQVVFRLKLSRIQRDIRRICVATVLLKCHTSALLLHMMHTILY